MVALIYGMIIILANTIGAVSGVGGGVIIKPLFESFHFHDLENILFFSCVAVFTMAVTTTIKQVRNGVTIDLPRGLAISVGSIIGGVLGSKLVEALLKVFQSQKEVQLIQITITVVSFIVIFCYTLRPTKSLNLTQPVAYFLVGIFLGMVSTLLGIGGGPINVTLILFVFGLGMKEAAIYSIVTILFSQLAKLVEIALSTGFTQFDLPVLWVIIPAAILGGYLGGVVSSRCSDKGVGWIFTAIVLVVILINGYNGWQLLQ